MNKSFKNLFFLLLMFGFVCLGLNTVEAISSADVNTKQQVERSLEVDFGPYMREMQRVIKSNWVPVKSEISSAVVLKYKIKKDGKLVGYSILESSGDKKMDSAAIKALKKSSPFKPLPVEFKGDDIEVQFTFNYDVHKK